MAQLPALNSNSATMSSRDIAEMTGKNHADVLRDIRNMLLELTGDTSGLSKFASSYLNSQNKEQPCFNLPKDESMCLVAGYDVRARMAIIKRWQELEAKQGFEIPKTLSGALRLAAEQAETIEQQQALIEHQKPAVAFVERFVEAKSAKGIREVAKILGIAERIFINMLAADGIIFKLAGNWVPMAEYQKRGLFEVKTGEANGHAFKQMRFTPDGLVWAAKRYAMAE